MPNYFTELKDGPSGPSFKVKDEEAEQAIEAIEKALGNKVDKEAGKGLSTNDYSDTEKGKVADNAEAIEAMVNVYGCCNILPNNASTTTDHGTSFTVNADKSVTISGVQDDTWGGLWLVTSFTIKKGTYILLHGDSTISGVYIQLRRASDNTDIAVTSSSATVEFTLSADTIVYAQIVVAPNTDLSTPQTVYPMLYDARLNPTGYVPYAMTNRELTERVVYKAGETISFDGSDFFYGFGGSSNCGIYLPLNIDRNYTGTPQVSITDNQVGVATSLGVLILPITGTPVCYATHGGIFIQFNHTNTSLTPSQPVTGAAAGVTVTL